MGKIDVDKITKITERLINQDAATQIDQLLVTPFWTQEYPAFVKMYGVGM